ncbi:MAG: hypothetical protein E3J72_15200 [Planctomycetota bacterium]|nr:MAG: hypothetical protein E3J72_15200 [Planctomycetota bacterium]
MGEIQIHFKYNRNTGRTDLTIDYVSDKSMMPHEHEERHEEIVDRLIEGGVIRREDIGNVEVRRIPPEKEKPEAKRREEPTEPEAQAEGEGA